MLEQLRQSSLFGPLHLWQDTSHDWHSPLSSWYSPLNTNIYIQLYLKCYNNFTVLCINRLHTLVGRTRTYHHHSCGWEHTRRLEVCVHLHTHCSFLYPARHRPDSSHHTCTYTHRIKLVVRDDDRCWRDKRLYHTHLLQVLWVSVLSEFSCIA